MAKKGRVKLSSPEITSNSAGFSFIMSINCSGFPLASFMAANFSLALANLKVVSAVILEPVLPGTLYKMIGTSVYS